MTEESKKAEGTTSAMEGEPRASRGERLLETLPEEERKAYEECVALPEGIMEDGSIDPACEVLERFADQAEDKPEKPE